MPFRVLKVLATSVIFFKRLVVFVEVTYVAEELIVHAVLLVQALIPLAVSTLIGCRYCQRQQ